MARLSEEPEAGAGDSPNGQADRIRVLLADDHEMVRAGIQVFLESQGDLEVVGEAGDGLAAVAAYRRLVPDVMLLDLQMPRIDGVEVISTIRTEFPDARIVVLTTYSGDAQAIRALDAGALGYMLKTNLRKELFSAIRNAHKGVRTIDQEVAQNISEFKNDQLTKRECEIVGLARDGRSNREIGHELGLAEETIKGYLKLIFVKLNASDRANAVAIAAHRGFITF